MNKRIMVVDDDPVVRSMLRDLLEAEGHEVVAEVNSGEEAVRNFKSLRPDIVIMDIVLPIRNGIDATRLIIAGDRRAKVIIVSALKDVPLIKAAFDSGAVDYIHKPFTPARVLEAIRSAS